MKRLEGSRPVDVIVRRQTCSSNCGRVAIYDLSFRNNIGVAGDWIPFCGSCAKKAQRTHDAKINRLRRGDHDNG